MQEVECAVIGAGVVGLAIARELAQHGHEVLVLEAEDAIGTGSSSRSSEVVHAGIYYPSDSLKATLCLWGREALYRYCALRSVPHHRCGKLIVAVDETQRKALARLHAQGVANGVQGLQVLDTRQALAREPELHCVEALYSPDTGIVDSHALMLALRADAEAAGAIIALRAPVVRASRDGNGGNSFVLQVEGEGACRLRARTLVNAAGHGAVALAAGLGTPDPPRAYFAKGHYFALRGRTPFRHLVYPLPEPGGLGIHLTLDLAGRARFGPDVEWVPSADYRCDPARAAAFDASIRRYWPSLPDDGLTPAYCGVRPKISGPGEPPADFRIDGPGVHGIPGLVQLFGIESPGLTACLAIGVLVRATLMMRNGPLDPGISEVSCRPKG